MATKFCKIFTLLLSYVVPVKSKVKVSQNFVAISEYMYFSKILFCFQFVTLGLIGSDKIIYWFSRYSFLLGFIMSKRFEIFCTDFLIRILNYLISWFGMSSIRGVMVSPLDFHPVDPGSNPAWANFYFYFFNFN